MLKIFARLPYLFGSKIIDVISERTSVTGLLFPLPTKPGNVPVICVTDFKRILIFGQWFSFNSG